jgi:predicted secreted hydrolase
MPEEAGDAEGDSWSRAISARSFDFPADHGSHEDFRIEWWYYTGNLQADDGRQFGYQLTFFRTGLRMQPQSSSRWALRNLYTAHFAISDIMDARHRQAQRNSRGAIQQAGAETQSLQVWNGDWEVRMEHDTHHLQAKVDGMGLQLKLAPTKPAVTHGENGLSRKGPSEGNASFYYSLTNMKTVGVVTVDGTEYRVTGKSWMDHEFSTSFLEPGQLGWDWFAIQFDDNTETMLYRMRREDGSSDPFSSGTFIDHEGNQRHLSADDFTVEPVKYWRSKLSGGNYPVEWKVSIHPINCQVYVTTKLPEQEMRTGDTTGITYWEGAIALAGERDGQRIEGQGYLEMTGYVGQGLGSILE